MQPKSLMPGVVGMKYTEHHFLTEASIDWFAICADCFSACLKSASDSDRCSESGAVGPCACGCAGVNTREQTALTRT